MKLAALAAVPPIPEPPCARADLRCLTNRVLWWAQAVYPRPFELLLFALCRWCVAKGQGVSAIMLKVSGCYARADRIERLHAE